MGALEKFLVPHQATPNYILHSNFWTVDIPRQPCAGDHYTHMRRESTPGLVPLGGAHSTLVELAKQTLSAFHAKHAVAREAHALDSCY